jgi:hypothetical protein
MLYNAHKPVTRIQSLLNKQHANNEPQRDKTMANDTQSKYNTYLRSMNTAPTAGYPFFMWTHLTIQRHASPTGVAMSRLLIHRLYTRPPSLNHVQNTTPACFPVPLQTKSPPCILDTFH